MAGTVGTGYYDSTTAMGTNYFASQTTVWTNWVSITNSATTADSVWGLWQYQGTASANSGSITYRPPRQRSTEDIEADRQRLADARREREQAEERAEALLREHLSKEQEQTLDRNGRFRVRGSKGGVFDICRGNVIELDPHEPDGRARTKATVCIHARGHVPEPDNMLAKKFMLETDEDEFRKIGNFSRR